jgi:hypothetical protein
MCCRWRRAAVHPPGRSCAPPGTLTDARTEVFEYIEIFFNRQRRHSTLGHLSRMQFEEQSNIPMIEKETARPSRPNQPVSTEPGELQGCAPTATRHRTRADRPEPLLAQHLARGGCDRRDRV